MCNFERKFELVVELSGLGWWVGLDKILITVVVVLTLYRLRGLKISFYFLYLFV